MARAGGNIDMFINRNSDGSGDIESGCITEQVNSNKRKASPTEKSLMKMKGVENTDGHFHDIDELVGSMERILEDVPLYICTRGHPGRISRIPENLRQIDVKGYEPYILSIGPYHFGKSRLQPAEYRKRFVLKCVLQNKPEVTLKDYLNEIMSIEPTVRRFYSDVEMESEQFVQMLLLDSMYLLTMFCGMVNSQEKMDGTTKRNESRLVDEDIDEGEEQQNAGNGTDYDDENLKMMTTTDEIKSGENWYWNWLAHDLFLLENQLPFFVLQKIYNLAYAGSETQLIDFTKNGVVHMLTYYANSDLKRMIISPTEEVHHLLHLCHMFLRPTVLREPIARHFPESSQMFRLGSAMQLYEAGVHFEARSASTEYSLLDITFDPSGKMIMPCLHVDDNTESLLRNLIALEQMKYPSLGLNISAYVVLLLHLVTTPKDVELLRRKEIIQHHLSSDKEMMCLVNRLSIGLAFDYVEDQYSLKCVFQELKYYSERRVPGWRAWLKHRYFSNPWTAISFLGASLLLLLTALQTYYAVYSYYYPCCDGRT